MGNCLDQHRVMTWVDDDGDDWGCDEAASSPAEKEGKLFQGSNTVKIRITKKELNELLEKASKGKLSTESVVEKLERIGSVSLVQQERHWRPKLQSIPEVAE